MEWNDQLSRMNYQLYGMKDRLWSNEQPIELNEKTNRAPKLHERPKNPNLNS